MCAPLAGNVLPEERMTPRERELCREEDVYKRQAQQLGHGIADGMDTVSQLLHGIQRLGQTPPAEY